MVSTLCCPPLLHVLIRVRMWQVRVASSPLDCRIPKPSNGVSEDVMWLQPITLKVLVRASDCIKRWTPSRRTSSSIGLKKGRWAHDPASSACLLTLISVLRSLSMEGLYYASYWCQAILRIACKDRDWLWTIAQYKTLSLIVCALDLSYFGPRQISSQLNLTSELSMKREAGSTGWVSTAFVRLEVSNTVLSIWLLIGIVWSVYCCDRKLVHFQMVGLQDIHRARFHD